MVKLKCIYKLEFELITLKMQFPDEVLLDPFYRKLVIDLDGCRVVTCPYEKVHPPCGHGLRPSDWLVVAVSVTDRSYESTDVGWFRSHSNDGGSTLPMTTLASVMWDFTRARLSFAPEGADREVACQASKWRN